MKQGSMNIQIATGCYLLCRSNDVSVSIHFYIEAVIKQQFGHGAYIISWTLQVLSWPRRHFIISGAGVQLFPSNFDYVFLQVFPLVLFKSLSNWIWLLIPCTGTLSLYSILERGGRSEGLFLCLLWSHSQQYVNFYFFGICHFLYLSVILDWFPSTFALSILLTLYIRGSLCFQGIIIT